MKLKNIFLVILLIVSGKFFAQETFPPSEIVVGTFIGKTIPLRDYPVMTTNLNNPEMLVMVPNENNTPEDLTPTTTFIQNLQTEPGQIAAFPIEQNFIGASASESGFFPPDPTGAVGPNHYVHSVNSLVKIFDKSGNLQVGPISLAGFLGIPSNSGDPIVLYDQLADRWIVSEFGSLNNSLAIGVSDSSDPAGAYNVWQYQFSGFPDYPHYGVWHDGYYGTVNLNGATTQGFVMERDVMLAGGANPQILIFNLPGIVVNPNQVKSPEPANLLGTTIDTDTPGYITYLQDDAWGGVSFDHLKVWEIDMDWANVGNSTISAPLEIPTDPFDAGELFSQPAIEQPGTNQNLSGHGGIISFAANYRSFGTHNSWLITFNTFIDANQTGGIRWIELRNDSVNPWAIFQEGTYSIADGHSRFMSSGAIDAAGNIGLGYSVASNTLPVGLRYTGRYAGDPLGQMTLAETTIVDGVGVRTNSNRYGDYSHTTMDPNNFTFWFTSDFFSSNNAWRTQIASFSIVGGFNADVGISNIDQPSNGMLTNTETVEVSIRNFGVSPQSNVPVELRLDGNLVASEIYPGTIPANSTVSYTFSQTVDLSNAGQTYVIESKTNLNGDEWGLNDAFTKDVTNLFANDVGALEITAPVTGIGLGNSETISVTLKNFGATTQSNFDVQYVINGNAPVVETYPGSVLSEEEVNFDFSQTADFSELGIYNISVSTSLTGDMNPNNDEANAVVESLVCQPSGDCSWGHGFELVSIAEINNVSGCEGYGDFTNLVANLAPGSTNELTVTVGYGAMHMSVWIDFNDDNAFTSNERVLLDYFIAPGQGTGTYTETVNLNIPADAEIGMHRMRLKCNFNAIVPANACQATAFGETEDYTVNIGTLGVDDLSISESDFRIVSLPQDQFDISMETNYDGGVYLGVYNILGQEIAFNKQVPFIDNAYRVKLDMSQMSSGVYLVKMGGQTTTSFKTGRLIVK